MGGGEAAHPQPAGEEGGGGEEGRGWAGLAPVHGDGRRVDTQNHSEVSAEEGGGPRDEQPNGRRMGKLKVAVYGEGALADSGDGRRSIQGPASSLL